MLLATRDFYSPPADSLHRSMRCCVLKLLLAPCFCLPVFGELRLVEEEETCWSSCLGCSGEARPR